MSIILGASNAVLDVSEDFSTPETYSQTQKTSKYGQTIISSTMITTLGQTIQNKVTREVNERERKRKYKDDLNQRFPAIIEETAEDLY